jgi:hypothetical protein
LYIWGKKRSIYAKRIYSNNQTDGDFWIGWIKEIPGVNCQEFTKEELIDTLRVTLSEAIEFNQQDAMLNLGSNYYEEAIMV